MPSRRQFLGSSFAAIAGLTIARDLDAWPGSAPIKITVYKSPTCGCCKLWVEHMEKNGFVSTVHDLAETALASTKKTMGIPESLQSCHSTVVGAYWVEGHVPADVVQKMLTEKPVIAGIAAPGMPAGSPGMEMGTKEPYDIIALDKSGKTRVYAKR